LTVQERDGDAEPEQEASYALKWRWWKNNQSSR